MTVPHPVQRNNTELLKHISKQRIEESRYKVKGKNEDVRKRRCRLL